VSYTKSKNENFLKSACGLDRMTYFFKLWDSAEISGTAENTNQKLSMHIYFNGY